MKKLSLVNTVVPISIIQKTVTINHGLGSKTPRTKVKNNEVQINDKTNFNTLRKIQENTKKIENSKKYKKNELKSNTNITTNKPTNNKNKNDCIKHQSCSDEEENITDTIVAIDTCCGINLVTDKNLLTRYEELSNPPKYYSVGEDNDPIDIIGRGFIPIKMNDGKVKHMEAFYSPVDDFSIISASRLRKECGYALNSEYSKLNNEIKIQTIDNSLYASLNDLIFDVRIAEKEKLNNKITKKIRMVKKYNPLKSKPGITLIEAHLRLNHVPAKVIRNSIQMNVFDDVVEIKEKKTNRQKFREEVLESNI